MFVILRRFGLVRGFLKMFWKVKFVSEREVLIRREVIIFGSLIWRRMFY